MSFDRESEGACRTGQQDHANREAPINGRRQRRAAELKAASLRLNTLFSVFCFSEWQSRGIEGSEPWRRSVLYDIYY